MTDGCFEMKRIVTTSLLLLFSLSLHFPITRGDGLGLTETDDSIRITLRGKPVLEYVKVARPVPEGIENHFSRSGYIHPVYSPTGQEITGDYPADHAHQHAVFFAWTKSKFDGKKTDFWNQAKQLAGVEFRKIANINRAANQVSFSAEHAFTVGSGDKRVDALYETWTVTVYQTPQDHFLFDIESVQRCATEKPLILEEYHYGGMAIRGNAQWLKAKDDPGIQPGDLRFLTSEGKDRWLGNHTRPDWVAMSGKLDGQDVSLTVFGSPDNFRAPQHVRLHPHKPYFCFAPAVAGKFKIEPGRQYVSRYRYLVTSGSVDGDAVAEHWQRYSKGGR